MNTTAPDRPELRHRVHDLGDARGHRERAAARRELARQVDRGDGAVGGDAEQPGARGDRGTEAAGLLVAVRAAHEGLHRGPGDRHRLRHRALRRAELSTAQEVDENGGLAGGRLRRRRARRRGLGRRRGRLRGRRRGAVAETGGVSSVPHAASTSGAASASSARKVERRPARDRAAPRGAPVGSVGGCQSGARHEDRLQLAATADTLGACRLPPR